MLNKANKISVSSSVMEGIKAYLMRNDFISDVEIKDETLIITGAPSTSARYGFHAIYIIDDLSGLDIFNIEGFGKYIKHIKINGQAVIYVDDHFNFNPNTTIIANEIFIGTEDNHVKNIKNLNCKCHNFKVESQFIRIADSYIECEASFVRHQKNILPSTIKKYVK